MVITVTIQSFNTSNRDTKRIDRDVQLAAITYMAVFAFLPVPVLVLVISSGRKRRRAIEMFGKGKGWVKLSIVVFTTFLMCLAMAVRAVTAWEVKPAFVKPWFDSKAAFYVFTFASEIVVVFTFLGGRVDQRFYVPDGSSRVRHYGGGQRQVGDEGEVEDHGHVEVQERGKLGLAA